MKAKIIDKKEIAVGTLMVTYKVEEAFEFRAGQYFFITLPKLKYLDEKGGRRQFSIVNSPNEKGVLTMATRISRSGFKKTLAELPFRTEIEVGPIAGAFVLPENLTRPLVFIAGGIGITPFMSMLRYVSEAKLPSNITLIYSSRNQQSTAFLTDLQKFSESIPNFKLILTMTDDNDWSGEKRMVDAKFIKEYTKDLENPYFMIVGPPLMTEAVVNEVRKIGISDENVKIEKFTGY